MPDRHDHDHGTVVSLRAFHATVFCNHPTDFRWAIVRPSLCKETSSRNISGRAAHVAISGRHVQTLPPRCPHIRGSATDLLSRSGVNSTNLDMGSTKLACARVGWGRVCLPECGVCSTTSRSKDALLPTEVQAHARIPQFARLHQVSGRHHRHAIA